MNKMLLLALACVPFVLSAAEIVSAGHLAGGSAPCSSALQALIDANPNREIYFPDGTYLLDKSICTPADPRKSVALRLSCYAVLKAAPGWTNTTAMVRLGGIHPKNDIKTVGSWYWLKGGIIDGSGVADGLSIDSGRETFVSEVSMKNVRIGLHIKRGANSGSSDCDISNVNIVGTGTEDSIGVLIDGHDNTLQKMRIAHVRRGMVVKGCGNCLRDIHPLFTGDWKHFDKSIGFEIEGCNTWGDFCYSDQFATGFRFGKKANGVFDKCFVMWYRSDKDMRHVALESEGKFNSQFQSLTIGFGKDISNNAVLIEGEKGGCGFLRDLRGSIELVKDPAKLGLSVRRM